MKALARLWLPLTCTAAAMLSMGLIIAHLLRGPELSLHWGARELSLLEPRGLYGLVLLPAVASVAWWSLSNLSWPRRSLSAGLRMLLMVLLTLGLSRPAERSVSTRLSTVFVADVSDSMSEAALREMAQTVRTAFRARGENHVALVTFARAAQAVALTEDAPLELARHGDGSASNIQDALALATGLFAPGYLRQVVLLSDGLETHGSVVEASDMLTRRDARLYVARPSAPVAGEAAIRDVVLPEPLKVGEPFTVKVELASNLAQDCTVRLFQNELLNGLESVRELMLAPGQTTLEMRSLVGVSGPVTYRAEISPGGADRFRENNVFTRTALAQGKPRVLYVEGKRGEGEAFSELLRAAGFDVDLRQSAGLPGDARELSAFDFLVLSDVPREEVSQAAMQAIGAYLEAGGGFLMAGGDQSFGLGGYRDSKLEQLLPVRLETERRRDQPSLALELVIDKSGSMNGEKIELAKEAARATAELLGSEDYLGVIGFDAQPTRVVRLATAGNRLGINQGIGKLAAGGGTLIFPALDAAYSDLTSVRARVKHVILLTDGQTQESGLPLLVQNMQVDGITVSAIGLGDDVNRNLIEELARLGHGRAYFTTDPSSVPRLFVRETHAVARSSAVEDYVTAQLVTPADFLRSIPIARAPLLRGYVATRPRPAPAQVILASDLGEPLLARMHVGLGWSLAWTSDLKPRWAQEWYRWPLHSAFWAQLIREHMRKAPETTLHMDTRLEGDDLVATMDALDRNERFLNGLAGKLQVKASEPIPPLEAELTQVLPGRYQARVRLPKPGSYSLSASLGPQEHPELLRASASFAFPFPLEYAPVSSDPARLLAAARATGGGAAPSVDQLFEPGARKTFAHLERWPWLLWAALVTYLADVAARRVPGRSRRGAA